MNYLTAAYILAWLAVCIYVAILAMRIRSVRTELVAVAELVREHEEKKDQ